jgi:CCR4-NOT transcriptional complex subunit CAF120
LIALATNKGPSQTQNGLVGAIETRERERAQMRQGIGGQAVAQAIDQRHREQNQQAQRAAQAAYAQQQAQFAAAQQQAQVRPQTPGGMGMMMGGAPSPYGAPGQQQPRPQTPGAMNMLLDGSAAPSVYAAPSMMGGMNPRSMSPGPGMHFAAQGPPQQPRPQMMPHSASYGGAPPPGAGGWNMGGPGGMPLRQGHGPGGPMVPPSPSMGMGMGFGGGGRPQSPAFQLPPQGQYAPPGTPSGPRPGTPGRMMQFHGQAF